jgi:hypothetical protein
MGDTELESHPVAGFCISGVIISECYHMLDK